MYTLMVENLHNLDTYHIIEISTIIYSSYVISSDKN